MSILEIVCVVAALTALHSLTKKNKAKIEELEARIKDLEKREP